MTRMTLRLAALASAASLVAGAVAATSPAASVPLAPATPPSSPDLLPACADLPIPSDPAADERTTNLFQNLYSLAGQRVLYGQEDDLAWNSVNTPELVVSGAGRHNGDSGVKERVNKYPAVFGWDIGQLELKGDNDILGSVAGEGRPLPLPGGQAKFDYDGKTIDGLPWTDLVQWIKEADAKGGINTISWSALNPITYGRAEANTYPDSVASVLPGGANQARFKVWLDTIVAFNSELKDGAGRAIPIIFRPYHEHSGDWFWWGLSDENTGITATTPAQFVDLWQYTVDYLRDQGVHNFLYAISPDRSHLGDPADSNGAKLSDSAFASYMTDKWADTFWTNWSSGFPGSDYVDVYGLDNYWDTNAGHFFQPYRGDALKLKQLATASLDTVATHARADGKLVALTQTDMKASQILDVIASGAAADFGQAYPNTIYTSWVLRWRGDLEGLTALADDSDRWFAGSGVDWSKPVPCSLGGLAVDFTDRQVQFASPILTSDKAYATGQAELPGIIVTDTRAGAPGWAATIQAADQWYGPGTESLPGRVMGLTPRLLESDVNQLIRPGDAVAAGVGFTAPGMALGVADPGASRGRAVLGGQLNLRIPASTAPGAYGTVLTVTVL